MAAAAACSSANRGVLELGDDLRLWRTGGAMGMLGGMAATGLERSTGTLKRPDRPNPPRSEAMAAAGGKSSTSDKVSTSSAVDEEIADSRSRRLTWREAWWPLAVAVAWVLLRSQQAVEQLLNRHARKPVTFTIVDTCAAILKAEGQQTTPHVENSEAAFRELRHPLETGEIEIVGTDFVRVGDLSSARLEMGKQQPIFSSEMSSLVPYNDHGELCLIPRDWRAAHGSTRTNLRGYRNILVRSAQLVGQFPEETEQLAHVPSEAVGGEKMKPKAWLPKARKDQPQRSDEKMSDYADRLHPLMETNATKVWPVKTLLRRLYEAAKADRQVAQEAHKAPRTV